MHWKKLLVSFVCVNAVVFMRCIQLDHGLLFSTFARDNACDSENNSSCIGKEASIIATSKIKNNGVTTYSEP